jgi:tetratricopeptide (TPR) repeat protein
MTEETVFELALNTPAADRPALLDRECAGDPALRDRVEALLAAHEQLEQASGGGESPPSAAVGETTAPEAGESRSRAGPGTPTSASAVAVAANPIADVRPAEGAGAVLAGRYKLVEEIGEGGMGSVWMAQQTAPVRRVVAVKVIKAGMDSRAVLARFEAERQALAMMDHPNIARVLDAGTTDSGRPYFVMELVKGVPITRFCDERRLSPRQRLELFVPVCQAIQHAHQKGVIHRDIKPSNVLIALYDDRPVPKVIDFGVAKATGPALTEHTLLTGFGGVVGTPEYMSPEQATLNNLDIDTRSDVYALGVLLYELLTGTTPVDRRRLNQAAVLEILRIVREVEPPTPSSRLSTLEGLPSIAANRSIEPARLARMLRGDLDWVVMKALEKDRSRRYETANALARDVQRHLADEAVEARRPSAGYRLRKFVRRNKGRVVAAGLVLLALVLGMLGTTWGLVRARRERDKAIQSENAERAARLHEEEQRKYAEAIAGFVRDDFLALTSVEGQYRFGDGPGDAGLTKDTTLRQLLDRAAEKLSQRRDLDPRTEAELNWIVGVNYRGVGEAARAVPYLERCLALRRQVLGRDEKSTLNAQNSLAVAYNAAGKLDAALRLHEETLRQRKARLGPDHPDTLRSMDNLAASYLAAGKLDLALPLLEETVRLMKVKLGPDHPHTLIAMNSLAKCYQAAGKLDLALPLLEETVRLMKVKLGPDHPDALTAMGDLAEVYFDAGKLDLALPLHEEVLRLRKPQLGPDHPHTLIAMNNLARGYRAAGKLDLALPLLEETVRLMKVKLGPDHPHTLRSKINLARGYREAGKLDLALPLFDEALRLRRAGLGPDHPDTLRAMNDLASGYGSTDRLDRSIPLFEETLRLQEKKLGRNHPDTLQTIANLGVNYHQAGRLSEALPLLEEADRASRTIPPLRFVGAVLLEAYVKAGRSAEAAALAREVLANARRSMPGDSPQLAGKLSQIAWALLALKAIAEAEPLLRECLAIHEKSQPDAWNTFNARSMLGGALLGQKKYAEAEPLLRRGYEGLKAREKAIPPPTAACIPEALDRLIELYTATNRPDEVKKWQAERAKYSDDGKPRPAGSETGKK